MTTKSGTDDFHGFAARLLHNRTMYARTKFSPRQLPAFPWEQHVVRRGRSGDSASSVFLLLRRRAAREELIDHYGRHTFADPAFIAFAHQNFPNTVGTGLFTTYAPAGLSGRIGRERPAQYFFPASQRLLPLSGRRHCNSCGSRVAALRNAFYRHQQLQRQGSAQRHSVFRPYR